MSEIHQDICPIMSRAVTFPRVEPINDAGDYERTRDEHLIEIPCLGDKCMWYISMDGECCIKGLALSLNAIFERME